VMRIIFGIIGSVAFSIAGTIIAEIADRDVRIGAAVVAGVVAGCVLAALMPRSTRGDILDLPEGWHP